MTVLATHAHPGSEEFARNDADHRALVEDLRERTTRVVMPMPLRIA